MKFCLLLELVNEQEAEAGDTDRRGWTDSTMNIFKEPEPMRLRDALDVIGMVEPRQQSGDQRIYYGHSNTDYNAHPPGDVQPGDSVQVSLVLPRGITEASASRIDRILKTRHHLR